MKLKTFLLTAISIIYFALPKATFAENLTVRLGQPKSPTNQNNFKLTFVALDIDGGDITVRCYKKSPSDSNFIKFDSDKPLIPGGNTDSCQVDSNIVNNSGTYSFKVIANSKESNVVSVNYNTAGPSNPGSYSKEKINSCEYRIKFRTADDGKTTKVELFRSDTLSISIDSGHKVASQNIGPNQEGQFVIGSPDCNKEYYFALRSVDGSDNASGIVGDSSTKYIYETTTTTDSSTGTLGQSAISISSGSQVTEGSDSVSPEISEEISPSPSIEQINLTESPSPEVLGTQNSRFSNLKWLLIPIAVVIAYIFSRPKKSKK